MPLDPLASLRNRIEKLEALLRTRFLERSSITDGVMTFIRGTLRLLEGAILEIVGTVNGSGAFNWSGKMTQTGETNLNGPTNVRGNLEVLSGGRIKVGGVILTPLGGGRIQVGDAIVIDAQSETITVGDDVVIDASGGGRIEVGGDGAVPIVIEAGTDGLAQIRFGDALIRGGASGIQMVAGLGTDSAKAITVTPAAIRAQGLPISYQGTPGYWVGADLDGTLRRYPSGSGGPMGGDFDWPFSLSIVTSEFGMRVHPVTGVTTMHNGIDFGAPAGTNIPAASRGTVLAAGFDSSRGNYVVLSHANGVETHYFHMQSAPAVSQGQTVTKGQTLGQVGNTGLSDGAHLHFEVHVNGTAINPRNFEGLAD